MSGGGLLPKHLEGSGKWAAPPRDASRRSGERDLRRGERRESVFFDEFRRVSTSFDNSRRVLTSFNELSFKNNQQKPSILELLDSHSNEQIQLCKRIHPASDVIS